MEKTNKQTNKTKTKRNSQLEWTCTRISRKGKQTNKYKTNWGLERVGEYSNIIARTAKVLPVMLI